MSLNWSWNHKIGEIVDSYGQTANLYHANCLAAIIYEWTEEDEETHELQDKYQVGGYWNDKDHLRNYLGIGPNNKKDNLYQTYKSIKLNSYYTQAKDILNCFIKAKMPDFKIEVYYEKPKTT